MGRPDQFQMGHYELVAESPFINDSEGEVRQGTTNRSGDNRELRVDESDLTFIRIDFQTRLQFGATEIRIGCPFSFIRNGRAVQLDPEDRDTLGALLPLYPDSLNSASVGGDGTLTLEFISGARVIVPQHAQYEAWEVHGHGYLVICVPGTTGDLAIWS